MSTHNTFFMEGWGEKSFNYHQITVPSLSVPLNSEYRVTRCPHLSGLAWKKSLLSRTPSIIFNSPEFSQSQANFLNFEGIFTILGDFLLENNATFGQKLAFMMSSIKICGRFSLQLGRIFVEKWSPWYNRQFPWIWEYGIFGKRNISLGTFFIQSTCTCIYQKSKNSFSIRAIYFAFLEIFCLGTSHL